jgi:hypothetical protein
VRNLIGTTMVEILGIHCAEIEPAQFSGYQYIAIDPPQPLNSSMPDEGTDERRRVNSGIICMRCGDVGFNGNVRSSGARERRQSRTSIVVTPHRNGCHIIK